MTTRNMVFVENKWQEVYEVRHPDSEQNGQPKLVAARLVSTDEILKLRDNGTVEFGQGDPGGDERLIVAPGAYIGNGHRNVVVQKAGPWLQ